MEELMKLPNCRAAFHQLKHGAVFRAVPKLSPPHPLLSRQLFSGSELPSPRKRPSNNDREIGLDIPLQDLPKYFSGGSQASEPIRYQLPADTPRALSSHQKDCHSYEGTTNVMFY